MEREIRREDLYSLREATHFTSFGLELGDKEASALADELISEMVNKRFIVLQIQEDSYCRIQLLGVSGTLPHYSVF